MEQLKYFESLLKTLSVSHGYGCGGDHTCKEIGGSTADKRFLANTAFL